MNPWQSTVLELLRNAIRFALWVALMVNIAMLAVFAVWFTAKFLWHLMTWCARVLFPGTW